MEPLHADVSDDQLQIFGNLHVIYFKVDRMAGKFLAASSGVAEDGERLHALGIGDFQSFDDVGGIAATGENDEHITRVRLDPDLLGENLLVADIVREGG